MWPKVVIIPLLKMSCGHGQQFEEHDQENPHHYEKDWS